MTNSATTTVDPHEKTTIECDEPNCRNFEIGHERDEFIHERTEFGEVTVSRAPSSTRWDIEIDARHEYTVAEAEELIGVLTAAVADARALNAGRA